MITKITYRVHLVNGDKVVFFDVSKTVWEAYVRNRRVVIEENADAKKTTIFKYRPRQNALRTIMRGEDLVEAVIANTYFEVQND